MCELVGILLRQSHIAVAALHTVTATFIPQQWWHSLATTSHTVTNTYATCTAITATYKSIAHSNSNVYTTVVVTFISSNITSNDQHICKIYTQWQLHYISSSIAHNGSNIHTTVMAGFKSSNITYIYRHICMQHSHTMISNLYSGNSIAHNGNNIHIFHFISLLVQPTVNFWYEQEFWICSTS